MRYSIVQIDSVSGFYSQSFLPSGKTHCIILLYRKRLYVVIHHDVEQDIYTISKYVTANIFKYNRDLCFYLLACYCWQEFSLASRSSKIPRANTHGFHPKFSQSCQSIGNLSEIENADQFYSIVSSMRAQHAHNVFEVTTLFVQPILEHFRNLYFYSFNVNI